MKLILERHISIDKKFTYYIWFDHENGLPRVLSKKTKSLDDAFKHFYDTAENYKYPKVDIINEIKL